MTNDKYIGFKRMAAFGGALALWAASMFFSYSGFKFDQTEILWFGLVLAVTVTVVELIFNTRIAKLNPTLLAAGILCYVYGVYTNITGYYVLQHGTLEGFFTGSNWLIPIFTGLITEVLPEAMFAWAMGAAGEGNLIGNVAEMFNQTPTKPHQPTSRFQQSDAFSRLPKKQPTNPFFRK
jgi:hypothetical protein